MMACMGAFTVNDACMKSLSTTMPLFQALFLRSVATLLLLLVLAQWQGVLRFSLPRRDWGLILLRTIGEIGGAYFFLTALFKLPIANVTAVLQALPLTVTLAGALFLREAVGWRRFLAIFAGFCGVMLIIRPGPDGFDFFTIYALIAVLFITLRDLASRRLSQKTPSMVVAIATAFGVSIFAGVGAVGTDWVPVEGREIALLGGATVFVMGGYLFSIMVMRIGDISFTAPFRYTSLLWALILGFVIFGEWPDLLTLLGSAIVVATGIFSFYRERKMSRDSERAGR